MTERAKRAAAELERRGWSMDDNDGKNCIQCASLLAKWGPYCPTCGTRQPPGGASMLEDLEAAIAAALGPPMDAESVRKAVLRVFNDSTIPASNRKVRSIKEHRNLTGSTLKESLDYVERYIIGAA